MPPPSLNHRVDWRITAARERKLRRYFAEMTKVWRSVLDVEPCKPEKRTVRITRLMGPRQRPLDSDNLGAYCKPVLDGMRDAEWLYRDDPAWCDLTMAQERAPKGLPAAVRFEITVPVV